MNTDPHGQVGDLLPLLCAYLCMHDFPTYVRMDGRRGMESGSARFNELEDILHS